MAQQPQVNDRNYDLWKVIAWNFYNHAVALGVIGTTEPPKPNDAEFDLIKKVTAYTAALS